VLRRAGLASEPDVRPVSVPAWVGVQVLAETGRIDEVARRLGVRSLDRAAALIGWDWTESPAVA
jgi:integrase/recombinase XerC